MIKIKQLYKKEMMIILILIIISLSIRLPFISDCLFHHDSVQLARAVDESLESGKLQGGVSGRFGFVFINSIIYWVFGNNNIDFILNLTSILFASLSIAAIYIFTWKLTKNKVLSIISSILYSLNPLFLTTTVYAKSHSMAVFFAMLSGIFLLKSFKKGYLFKVLFVITFFLSLTVRSTNLYYILPFILIVFFKNNLSKKNIFLIMVPIIIYSFFSISRLGQEFASNSITINSFVDIIVFLYLSSSMIYQTITPLGIILLLFSTVIIIWKKVYRKLALILLIWFLPYFVYFSLIETTSARLFIPILYTLIMIISIGINYIYNSKKIIALILIFAVMGSFLYSGIPIVSFRHDYCGPKEFSFHVKNQTPSNSIVISGDESVFIEFYGNRSTIGFPSSPSREQAITTMTDYYNIIENNQSLFITGKVLFQSDKDQTMLKNINENFILTWIGEKISEEYHHAELELNKKNQSLYSIELKQNHKVENFVTYYFE